jgi:hypothetical protein
VFVYIYKERHWWKRKACISIEEVVWKVDKTHFSFAWFGCFSKYGGGMIDISQK